MEIFTVNNSYLACTRINIRPHIFLYSAFLFSHLGLVSNAYSSPEGGQVVGGAGNINQSGLNTTIKQYSQNMAIDWQSYNVKQNERVQYVQPNASSISLNRIVGNNASSIQGKIDANGQVILVNPNGIFFSATSSINVGGLMASGLDIKPSDFMNGNYIFNEVLGTNGIVFNSGIINASTGGSITLLGKQVKNDGMIVAKLGAVNMAAGKQAVLTFDNAGLLGVRITKEVLQNELGIDPAVLNNGSIIAEGGRILLTASVSQDIFSRAVNTGGMVDSTSAVVNADGTFTLGLGADVVNNGTLNVSTSEVNKDAGDIVVVGINVTSSGVIKSDAINGNGGNIELHATDTMLLTESSITSARSEVSGKGGNIKVLGNKVGLFDQAWVDASGAKGGGEVLIGGDKTGKNKQIRNAEFIYLGENTNVNADALDNGNGGKLITFARDTARIYGKLSARGGGNGGNGGFIETSGLSGFVIDGAPDTSASIGKGGEWLIDPYNISIVSSGTTLITGDSNDFFTSNAGSSQIDVADLYAALTSGSGINTVTITTGNNPAITTETGNITFSADFDYSGGGNNNGSNLILNAAGNITATSRLVRSTNSVLNIEFNANYSAPAVTGPPAIPAIPASGTGSVILTNSLIETGGGNFTALGVDFTLTDPVGGKHIDTQGGNISLDMTGIVTLDGDVITQGGTFEVVNSTSMNTGVANNTRGNINTLQGTTGAGTVKINSSGAVNIGTNITTKGSTVDIVKSGSFTLATSSSIDTSNRSNGNVAINSTGLISSGGIITTNNGTVGIKSTGATAALAAIAVNNGITTNGANVSIDGGNLSNTGAINTTGGGGGVSMAATGTINSNGQITTGSGNVDLVSTGTGIASNITIGTGITTGTGGTLNIKNNGVINAATAPLIIGGVSTIANTGTNAITLTGANNFQNTVQITNTSGAVNINDINNIDFAASNVGMGSFIVTAGGNISQTGASSTLVQVADASTTASFTAGGAITLNSNNDFTNTVSLNNSSGSGNVSITDINNIDFATSNLGSGTLTVNAIGITQTGGAITQATGAGQAAFNSGGVITLGNTSNEFTGDVSLNNAGANNVVLADISGISLAQSTVSQNLTITAGTGSDITELNTGTGINVAGNASFNVDGGRSIILGNTSNQFNGLSFNAKPNTGTTLNNVTVANASGLDLQTLNLTGNLSVTAGGNISNTTGSMVVAGTTTLDAGNNDITLATGANNFNNVAVTAGKNLTISDINGLNFSGVNLSGNLTVAANGTVSQTVAIIMQAATTADISAGSGQVNFGTAPNDFDTVKLSSSNAVNINDTNNITIDTTNITGTGTLSVTANGAINDTANNINVAGLATFAAGNNAINLATGNHDFSQVGVTNASALTIRDRNSLTLASLNLTGGGTTLNVTTAGLLNQTANPSAIVSNGNTIINTGANAITLGNTNNNFGGTVSLNNTAGNVLIADANSIDFTTSNIGTGTFTVNAGQISGGGISQTAGAITQAVGAGAVVLNARDGAVTLGSTSNDFTGNVTLNTAGTNNTATIVDINNIQLADANITGDLNVTAGTASDITQLNTGNGLTVAGTSTFNVDGGRSIALGNTRNNFNGLAFNAKPGGLSTLQNVTVANSSGLDLQTLNLTGNLNVTAVGDINNTAGSMVVAGVTTLNSGSGNNIALATGTNDFNEMVIVAANNVSITDVNGLNIGDSVGTVSNISGDLVVVANGNITQTAGLTMFAGTIATFDAGSGGINLSTHRDTNTALNNDFKNVVLNATGNVSIADINTITIGDVANTVSNIGGNFTVNANGAINQTAAITMNTGTTASFTAGTGAINLGGQANDFDVIELSSSNAVSINDVAGGLSLGATTITGVGTLSVVANGDINNTAGNINVAGLTTLDTGTNNINLATGTHDFNNVVFTGGNVNLSDSSGINIGGNNAASSASGTFIISANGNITDTNSSSVSIANASTINAGSGDIVLTNTDFQGSLSATARNSIIINNGSDLNVANATAASLVDLTSGGIINGGSISSARVALQAINGINVTMQTSTLKADNTTGSVIVNNTGNLLLESLTTSGDITLNNDANISMGAGSVNANYDIGNLDMTSTSGSFIGVGAPDINNADVTAFTATFVGRNGSFGSVVRPLVLNVKESVLINTRRSISPKITAPGPRLGVTDLSDLQFDFNDAANALSGEQLISLEELEDIDPAIFSDVRNYTYGQIAILLPRDQLFEDELKAAGDK